MTFLYHQITSTEGIYDYLLGLLQQLDGVSQSPKYHPEGDALYHSLQVFQLAHEQSDDPELWAAALLHDVGKAVDPKHHDVWGSNALSGILSERVCWLILHHLDLFKQPGRTVRQYRANPWLADLKKLRHWDVAGRSPYAQVQMPEEALSTIFQQIPVVPI